MKKHVGHGAAARLLAGLLCLVMLCSLLPAAAWAKEDEDVCPGNSEGHIPMFLRYRYPDGVTEDSYVPCQHDRYRVYQCACCGKVWEELAEHTDHLWSRKEQVPPTYDEHGKPVAGYSVFVCDWCGQSMTGEEIQPCTDGEHAFRTDGGQNDLDPTCTEDGYYWLQCEKCGLKKQVVIPALGHDPIFDSWGPEEPDCTSERYKAWSTQSNPYSPDSYTAYYKCSRCHQTVGRDRYYVHNRNVPIVPMENDVWHHYEAVETVGPTAYKEGYTLYRCRGCGAEVHGDIVPALGTTYAVPDDGFYRNPSPYGIAYTYNSQVSVKASKPSIIPPQYAGHPVRVNITGSDLWRPRRDKRTARLVILEARNIYEEFTGTWNGEEWNKASRANQHCNNDNYINITYSDDSIPLDVYLLNFGEYTDDNNKTSAIRSITITGSNVNVYLVNSNLGYTRTPGETPATITIHGSNNHVWMGDECNLTPGMPVTVDIDSPVEEGAEYYDTAYYETYEAFDLPREHWAYADYTIKRTPAQLRSTVRLARVHLKGLRSAGANQVLNGLSGVELIDCTTDDGLLDSLRLSDWAELSVSGKGSIPSAVTLNDRAGLALSGVTAEMTVTANGLNTLRLNDTAITGSIRVNGGTVMLPDKLESYQNKTSNRLTLLLGGQNRCEEPYRDGEAYPAIMVDNAGSLLIKDDPDVEGTGALTVKANDYTGVAAIGGTPSDQDPKPHGAVAVVSGVLNAEAVATGRAAIGGSVSEGYARDGGTFRIVGGVVNARSEGGGAAIGGAYGGNGGVIEIGGGTVNATAEGGAQYGQVAAAIGGGAPEYEQTLQTIGWAALRPAGISTTYIVPVENESGEMEYYEYTAADPTPHSYTGDVSTLAVNENSAIRTYKYTYVRGGGSGKITIQGGSSVNAVSENPAYDALSGDPLETARLFCLANESYPGTAADQLVYARYWDLNNRNYEINDEYLMQTHYFVRNSNADGRIETVPMADLEKVSTGRKAGYVLGSTWPEANFYRDNKLSIHRYGGLNPVVVLRQNAGVSSGGWYRTNRTAAWDNYYFDYRELVTDQSTFGVEAPPDEFIEDWQFYPLYVYDPVILRLGWLEEWDTETDTDNSRYILYEPEQGLEPNKTYRVSGQISLSAPGSEAVVCSLPTGTSLTLTGGAQLNVGENFVIAAVDKSQFVVEAGAVVRGTGSWPGKPPVDPAKAPSTRTIKKLIETMTDQETGEVTAVTHLGVASTSDGCVILSGASAQAVRDQADALSLQLLTVLSEGTVGFRKRNAPEGTEAWELAGYDSDMVVSLVENGALSATPGNSTGLNTRFNVIVQETGGRATMTLRSAKLHTPEYKIYDVQDDELTVNFKYEKGVAFRIGFSEDQIRDNRAVFSVPSFYGSEFRLESVAVMRDKCALRYGGKLKFCTPIADFAGIEINQLQLKYGDGVKLDGIEGGGHVEVPSIAGFSVTGSASMYLNTFAPKREFTMSVELDTPIFEGAFKASFKEARGVILLDTLVAELAVGQGIPLVPPTVIGTLDGGRLGFEHLADTVSMDSFGAPPIRGVIGAKGSIMDVIKGWINLSVGLDGFDLDMTDIKIADAKFIKSLGISAKWDAGKKTVKGKEYWGLSTDMSQYIVISVMLPGYEDEYGWDENDFSPFACISAKGTVNYGGFAGYSIDEESGCKVANFIYQLHASGNLSGSLKIPQGIVLNVLPPKTLTLAQAELGFYAAATASSKVDASKVSGSPNSILSQLARNAKIDFDAAIGAKVSAGAGKLKGHVRVIYVLGEKGVKFDGGWGEGEKLDLSGQFNTRNATSAVLTTSKLPDSDEAVPTIIEAGARRVAVLCGDDELSSGEGVTLRPGENPQTFTAHVGDKAAGNVFLVIRLSDETALLTAEQVAVTHGTDAVTLVKAQYDENGFALTDASGSEVTPDANFDVSEGIVYFAPTQAGNYTIQISGDGPSITGVDAIKNVPFAELNQSTSALTDSAASYSVKDPVDGRGYKVQLVLGREKGAGDYLLAESDLLDADSFTGDLAFALSGAAAPGGDYYPSLLLLEYVEAADEQTGEAVGTWALVDQKQFDATVHYENTAAPAAPQSVTLTAAGNETMTAAWNAVDTAGAYRVTVYARDASGAADKDTGLFWQVDAAATKLTMDLSSLEKEQDYLVGVKAIVYDEASADPEHPENRTYQTGAEARSAAVTLKTAAPPTVSYSDAVVTGEGNTHAMSVGPDGRSFTITADQKANIRVSNRATGTVLASKDGTKTLKVNVPLPREDAGTTVLEVLVQVESGDYVLDYITLSRDIVPPPLTLNDLGVYPLRGSTFTVAGYSEAGASVTVWQRHYEFSYGSVTGEYYSFVSSGTASEDGSFAIPVPYAPDELGGADFCAQATDAAGNQSAALAVSCYASETTIRLDPNGDAVCEAARIGVQPGAALGALPVPVWTGEDSMLFDGWFTGARGGVAVESDAVFVEQLALEPAKTHSAALVCAVGADAALYLRAAYADDRGDYAVSGDTLLALLADAEDGSGKALNVHHWKDDYGVEDDTLCELILRNDAGAAADTVVIPLDLSAVEALSDLRLFVDGAEGCALILRLPQADGTTQTLTCVDAGTLYAHWTQSVSASFVPGDGASCPVSELRVRKGEPIGALPEPQRTDGAKKLFDGWQSKDGTAFTASDPLTADVTLHAVWADAVLLTFDAGVGGCVERERLIRKGTAVPDYPDASAEGYAFDGWYMDTIERETVTEYRTDPATNEKIPVEVVVETVVPVRVDANTRYDEDTLLTAHWIRNTEALEVSQQNGVAGRDLADPVFVAPAQMLGSPLITYNGVDGTNYQSTAKPTRAGSYLLCVQCETVGASYVGTSEFRIDPNVRVTLSGAVADGKLTAAFTAPAESLLIAASYDASGRQLDLATFAIERVETGGSHAFAGLAEGAYFKLMLIDAVTCAPLCEAWSSKA